MDYKKYFKNKIITVMGLGLLGRGLGDVQFLAECGADLIVTDIKTESELSDSLSKLKNLFTRQKFFNKNLGGKTYKPCEKNSLGIFSQSEISQGKLINFHLGGHRLEDFCDRDFILKAAGVPLDSPFIVEARKNGIPIEMDASLFAKLAPPDVKIIGITGTRGKSTVTALIYSILKKAGKKVYLGGNVKDTATLPLLKKVKSGDFVVMELDSWQLQGFGDSKISPNISVFTTFLPDHMNYYKNDMDKYLEDKSNIFKYQKGSRASIDGTRHDSAESDVLIMGEKVACLLSEKYGTNIKSKFVVAGKEIVPKDWKIKIPGEHNLENIACAVSASRELGIPEEIIKKAVENFKGVSGRLELVRTINGVKIYNDTTATTPEATMAALRALSTKSEALNPKQSPKIQNSKLEEEKRIVLIMGGADKSLDMARLVEEIPKYCKTLILLEGNGTSKIGITKYELRSTKEEEKLIIHNSKFIIQGMIVNSLKQAVIEALSFAKKNDILLFSPAFASFGMFKNEYDRGEQFNEIVSSIRG